MKENCDKAGFNLIEAILNLKDLLSLSSYEKFIGE
jgi:hypothetical protein